MTPSVAVKTRLLEVAAVTAQIATRIYVDILPQKPTLPCVRVERIDEIEEIHLRGARAMRRARVQVDAVALSLETAVAVSDAAHGDGAGSALSGWTGTVGAPPQRVFAIRPIDTRSDYEGAEIKQWRVSRDYYVELR